MKKTLAAVLTAALIALGLVAVSGGPSNAACPYSACIDTTTKVRTPGSVKQGNSTVVRARVRAAGNARPQGFIRFIVKRKKGGFYFAQLLPYRGGQIGIATPRLRKKGKYTAIAKFKPGPGTVWQASQDSRTFKVKKRRNR